MSLGQSVEAGTWLIAREVWRRSDVAPQARWRAYVCAARIPGSPVASTRSSPQPPQRGGCAGRQPERVLAIPPQLESTSEQGDAPNVSLPR